MLNLATVALLSGALLAGSPDGDRDKDKKSTRAPEAQQTVATSEAPADVRAITNDSYAFGRPADSSPIKLWVAYAYGESEAVWAADGETVDYDLSGAGLGVSGDIISQRALFGVQLNVINFPGFKLGVGGQLVAGSNEFQYGEDNPLLALDPDVEGLDSGFGLQNVKVFGSARGRVVGLHGGYIIDLADDNEDGGEENFFPLSDNRDAIFFGADFDYPSERFRLFGGVDYFARQDDEQADSLGTNNDSGGNNILVFNMGAGIRFGFVELGAALMINTTLVEGEAAFLAVGPQEAEDGGTSNGTSPFTGGHAGTIAPYLKLSPPSLPVSLFVKGAVLNEYSDYGYAIGGANDIKPSLGFTAGLTIGFE